MAHIHTHTLLYALFIKDVRQDIETILHSDRFGLVYDTTHTHTHTHTHRNVSSRAHIASLKLDTALKPFRMTSQLGPSPAQVAAPVSCGRASVTEGNSCCLTALPAV